MELYKRHCCASMKVMFRYRAKMEKKKREEEKQKAYYEKLTNNTGGGLFDHEL